jgi:uncharacterized Zn finger protein (UPF0148 family)
MAIRCPYCGREYDVTLFEFEREISCVCGHMVRFEHREHLERRESSIEEEKINEIKRLADRIAFLIVSTDYPEIDIMIEKERLREKIEESFPDKAYLYELIYEPRFRRLFEQFRGYGEFD